MTTPTYNLLAVRKTIGAIHHRIAETGLDPAIRRRIIQRQLDDLLDTLPPKFEGIVRGCVGANAASDTLELVAGLALIESMLPQLTYGAVVAGTAVRIPNGGTYIKRKTGAEEIHTSALFKHLPADQIVEVINL